MLLTEEEARQQTCPLIHHCLNEGAVFQQNAGPVYVHQRCQGSACKIGWRWGQPPRETLRNYHDAPTVKHIPGGGVRDYPDGWQYEHTDTDRDGRKFDLLHRLPADDAPRVGYCGAFGKPEV